LCGLLRHPLALPYVRIRFCGFEAYFVPGLERFREQAMHQAVASPTERQQPLDERPVKQPSLTELLLDNTKSLAGPSAIAGHKILQ
jgi:hypothetical protein